MSRRAILCVPASEPGKVAKALALTVDEVVVDLEDAVSVDMKDSAREHVAGLPARARGRLTVRVNALGTAWCHADVAACVANPNVTSIVVPKSEDAGALRALAARLDELEVTTGRPHRLRMQALIESPHGVHNVVEIAQASPRLEALILGYADLSASIGRRVEASWQFAQDAVVLGARIAGLDAVDGPQLTIAADEALERAAVAAEALGFDGKWVIHPAQIDIVQRAFTPTDDEIAEAREVLAVLESAAEAGRGAAQWRGRMLDEAIAVRARRTLSRKTL